MKKVLVLLCTILCANVLFAQTTFTIGDLTYKVTSITTVEVSDCVEYATSVTIPSTVTYSGISLEVTSIGNSAFYRCSSLTSVTIPNSVTSIGNYAFDDCNSLTSVTIPNSVTSIGEGAFYSCDSLTSVNIPNSVTSIGYRAFYNCDGLTSITIPNSVTSIGIQAFRDCSSLTTLNFNATNCSNFICSSFSYTSYSNLPFYDCPINTINIGDSVQRIPDYFAYGCDNLTSIDIPNSVTSIGYEAFRACGLTSVTIPNSVTSIGESAFIYCSGLTSVDIGNNITSIGEHAFYNCESLTSFTCRANTPPSIGNATFYNTPSNKTLNVNCESRNYYILLWSEYFNSNNIHEITFVVNATANNETFGSVAVENNCSTATLTATANNCYQFVSWNDGNTDNPRIVNLTSDTSFIATFEEINFNTELSANICQGQVYTENGFNVSEAGVYTQNLTSVNGCDSIVTLTLNVNPIFNTELTATICQGQAYTENGFNVSEAGVYSRTLQAINGCDSVVNLTLSVNPIFNTNLSATICEGQVYTENNFNISEAGVYTQTLTSVNGCDSIITLTLNILPSYNTNLTATICEGSELNISGFNVTEGGVYTQTYTAVNGCDSIVTLTVTENPTIHTDLTLTICEGTSLNFSGFNVSEAGVYTQTHTAVNGCDSIVTLTVTELPTVHTDLTLTICEGTSLNFSGFNVSEAGIYTQTHTAVNGCDSIVTLTVSVNPTFDTTINATINAGETYAEFGFNESEAGTYVQNLQTEFGCDSTITLVLSVNSSLLEAEIEEISFYPNPTKDKITFSQMIEKVEVIDLTGKTILTFSNAKTINIESLPSGAYYLRLTNEEIQSFRKFIKQ